MRGSIRLFKIFNISINIHITFLLLIALFISAGVKSLVLILSVFFFVTLHELSHALVAKRFGIEVSDITLLPIGGVASMRGTPEKPIHEFLISLAGPLLNVLVLVVFFLPLRHIFGPQFIYYPLSTATWPLTIIDIYKINFFLAAFNLIPAFPMDGGRILRSILAQRIGYQRATRIAVNFGHLFAFLFAFLGIAVRFNIIWIAIAIFIYMAASSEEAQVDIKETLKKIRVRDILAGDFLTIKSDTALSKVLELIFHSHQEDFPVMDNDAMAGFVTRQDIVSGIHRFGVEKRVGDIMRTDFPTLKDGDTLVAAHALMQEAAVSALPVMRDGRVIGVVTLEDIGRVYSVVHKST